MRLNLGALGAAAVNPNPNAGTYSDINCPTSCWLLGNGLDMSILGQECWPCHNICPSGSIWDTANNVCSGNPTATAAPNTGCPGYCSWTPFASTLFPADCGPCSDNSSATNYGLWLALGAVGFLLLTRRK